MPVCFWSPAATYLKVCIDSHIKVGGSKSSPVKAHLFIRLVHSVSMLNCAVACALWKEYNSGLWRIPSPTPLTVLRKRFTLNNCFLFSVIAAVLKRSSFPSGFAWSTALSCICESWGVNLWLTEMQVKIRMQILYNVLPEILGRLIYCYQQPSVVSGLVGV
jgi:hypothetical protein